MIIVVLSQMGIILDYVFDPTTRARHGLGFSWTTTGPILFFYLCLSLVYINRNKLSIKWLVLMEIINIWLFYMTDSKMAFFFLSIILVFFGIQSLNKRRWHFLSKFNGVYISFPFLMMGLSLVVVKIYDWNKPFWALIDRTLSYRLGLAQNAFEKYGIHLSGQAIQWVGYDYKTMFLKQGAYNYVDNSYLQIAFNNGAVFLLAVLAMYSYGIYKATKRKDYWLVWIYLIILLLSLTEPRLMNFAYNPFPLVAMGMLVKKPPLIKEH